MKLIRTGDADDDDRAQHSFKCEESQGEESKVAPVPKDFERGGQRHLDRLGKGRHGVYKRLPAGQPWYREI